MHESMFSSAYTTWHLRTHMNCADEFHSLNDIVICSQPVAINSLLADKIPKMHILLCRTESVKLTSGQFETYIHTYIYEIYNALHSRAWLESEARAVAKWRGLGRNGRDVECF